MGPFQEVERFEFADHDRAIVLAPNGTGKTSTIDLMRWLLLGEDAAGELKSLNIRGLLHSERATSTRVGSVSAEIEIEGRGTYRITRRARLGTIESQLTIERESARGWVPEENPPGFLLRFFPRERIGFNLLTGEHISAFTKELQEDAVKSSVEKLLRFPEIATAQRALANVSASLERMEDAERSASKSARAAIDQVKGFEQQLRGLDVQIEAVEKRKAEWNSKIADLNKQIGAAEGGVKLEADLQRFSDSIKHQEQARVREWEKLAVEFSDSWQVLARQAAIRAAHEIVENEERYIQADKAWSARQGETHIYREILHQSECICTRPVDAELRDKLAARIEALEADRPLPPTTPPVPSRTLRAWLATDGMAPFLERVGTAYRHYGDVCDDLADLEKDRENRADQGTGHDAALLRDLQAQRRTHEIKVRGEDNEIRRLLDLKAKLNSDVITARRKADRKAPSTSVAPLANLAAAYSAAFRDLVESSIPYYRERMQERVQEIFRSLYQKNDKAEVDFLDGSYLPRIRMMERGQQPSPGEKVRLGVSLLLAFRDIAAERPFLFLDAPFSELDDEGQDRLLRVLSEQDSQIVIFTKNRFPPEPFRMVKSMEPKVHELQWEQSGRGGRTRILDSDIANLLRRDSR